LWTLVLSFVLLLGLIAVYGWTTMRRARSIHDEMVDVHTSYLHTNALLHGISDSMYRGGFMLRDFLLDPLPEEVDPHREQLQIIRASVEKQIRELQPELGEKASPAYERLRKEVEEYWETLEPIFHWTPKQKQELARRFLMEDVLPRWSQVLSLAEEINQLNESDLREGQQRLEKAQDSYQRFLQVLLVCAIELGIGIAVFGGHHFMVLLRRSEAHHKELEHAEQELRRLSRHLVQAQEEERKYIARELHDSVGQALTAIGFELSSLAKAPASAKEFEGRVRNLKQLNQQTLASLRDLAMGLRPSMLDDMGLGAALEWQGRQFSRRLGIPVDVGIEGPVDTLPDPYRTCVFRVVQESLTNCAKHAQAKHVNIRARFQQDVVHVMIQDDGKGFDRHRNQAHGIGLLGMQERVQELGGKFSLASEPKKGTRLEFDIPVVRTEA
jgi:signal transduction histidine kinase